MSTGDHSKYLFLIQRKFIMKTSLFSINGINKGKLLAAALLIGLAFASPAAFAVDAAAGQGSAANITVTNTAPTFQQLRQVSFNLAQTSQCVAVASALVTNPVNGDDLRYQFGLALDTINGAPTPVGGSLQDVDFDNPSGEQPDKETVSSTFVFSVPAGQHTIRWMAAKRSSAFPDFRVDTSSLSVMCFDTLLQ
jgi:hypothetical protein